MKDIFTVRFCNELEHMVISQTQLAALVGISKQCISDFKSGKSYPSIQTLRDLAVQLNVSTDYLLGLEEADGSRGKDNYGYTEIYE
ncbi:MAG: helix-turn-helix domain-containing protein [Roseburia sp.]|nr:helix-turn-helix domain-containing protein [Roseburia sp.]